MAHTNLFEWKAVNGQTWYPINNNKFVFINIHSKQKLLLWKKIRNFINQMLLSCTVEIWGRYWKPKKVIVFDLRDWKVLIKKRR